MPCTKSVDGDVKVRPVRSVFGTDPEFPGRLAFGKDVLGDGVTDVLEPALLTSCNNGFDDKSVVSAALVPVPADKLPIVCNPRLHIPCVAFRHIGELGPCVHRRVAHEHIGVRLLELVLV